MSAYPPVVLRRQRLWPIVASVGCALVVIALATVALVLFDKPHFGWLVGSLFLEVITSGVVVGSIVFLIAAWNLPGRTSWRGLVLFAWGLVALLSPLFGLLFLLPWGLLVVLLPLVVTILVSRLKYAPGPV